MPSTTSESLPYPFALSKGLLPASASTLCVASGNRLFMKFLPNSKMCIATARFDVCNCVL